MDKKKIIIAFSILATFLIIAALALMALEKEPPIEVKIEKAKQEAVGNAEVKITTDEGFTNASIISVPEKHFQITYQEETDRFSINIDTGGSNANNYLSRQEVLKARAEAEKYFIESVLKTEDKEVICNVGVRILTIGYGDFNINDDRLNYCVE